MRRGSDPWSPGPPPLQPTYRLRLIFFLLLPEGARESGAARPLFTPVEETGTLESESDDSGATCPLLTLVEEIGTSESDDSESETTTSSFPFPFPLPLPLPFSFPFPLPTAISAAESEESESPPPLPLPLPLPFPLTHTRDSRARVRVRDAKKYCYRRWGSHSQVRPVNSRRWGRRQQLVAGRGQPGQQRWKTSERKRGLMKTQHSASQAQAGGGGFCGPNLALALTLGLQPCT